MKSYHTKIALFLMTFNCFEFNFQAQNNALKFDGINDNITISHHSDFDFSINDSFTIESWFNTSATGQVILFSKVPNVPPYRGYDVSVQSGLLTFAFLNTYVTNCIWLQATTPINDGQWHHYAIVYNGISTASNVEVYIDGAVQTKTVTFDNLTSVTNNTYQVNMGSRNNTNYYYPGLIDEVRVWRRALCGSEILARKNCELQGNEYGLVAYYNFNQGVANSNNTSITTLTDLTSSHNGTLTGFALNGTGSNFASSSSTLAGTCNYYGGNLTVSGNDSICAGSTNTLSANGALTYTWSNNANTSSTAVSPTVSTNYTVTATEYGNCVSSRTCALIVGSFANPLAINGNSTICAGMTEILSASSAATYTWSNNATTSTISVTPTATTFYTLTATGLNNCPGTTTFTLLLSDCVGIETHPSAVQNIVVYPNPLNSGLLTISGIGNEATIMIHNALGEILIYQNADSENVHIDLENLKSGIYFIQIKTKHTFSVVKLIKD